MRYATAAAFRQALDDRLKTEVSRTGLPLARLRTQVAFELFLRRLVAVAPNRWVLRAALRRIRDVRVQRVSCRQPGRA